MCGRAEGDDDAPPDHALDSTTELAGEPAHCVDRLADRQGGVLGVLALRVELDGHDRHQAPLRRRSAGRAARCRERRLQARVMREHLVLQRLELGRRLDAQLVGEQFAQPPIGAECLGRPTSDVQGAHQLRPSSLAQRVLGDELFELADHRSVVAQRELGINLQVDGVKPELGQAGALGLQRGELDPGEWFTAPPVECGGQGRRANRRITGPRCLDITRRMPRHRRRCRTGHSRRGGTRCVEAPSALRSSKTYFCKILRAVAGDRPSHRSSTRRSVDTSSGQPTTRRARS